MILDTTLLVDLLRGDGAALATVEALEASGGALRVPAPVVFELFEGIERADRPHDEVRRVEEVLDGSPVLPMEPRHAQRAGRVSGRLVRQGAMVDPLDLLTAGTALEEGEAVLTTNVKDFERVPGLAVERY